MSRDIGRDVDRPYGRDNDTLQSAAMYLIRTGRSWALDIFGLSEVPVPERYAAARDAALAREPAAVQPRTRRPKIDRSHPDCKCAPRGLPYRLCPVHGEPGVARPAETPVQRSDLGGVTRVPGPRGTVTRVHVGPADGVCSVDETGCGFCLGIPCRSPRPATPTGDDTDDEPTRR